MVRILKQKFLDQYRSLSYANLSANLWQEKETHLKTIRTNQAEGLLHSVATRYFNLSSVIAYMNQTTQQMILSMRELRTVTQLIAHTISSMRHSEQKHIEEVAQPTLYFLQECIRHRQNALYLELKNALQTQTQELQPIIPSSDTQKKHLGPSS